ncbi:MAG: radical SAM protein [Deltaproteobacteria bacterium]|nr:radical SAM protein [Deltaproteobacteria bacterium]
MAPRRPVASTPRVYAELALNAARSNFQRLPFPYKLTYAFTYRCNYGCKTCEIWRRRPVNELSLDEIRRLFARSDRFSWIDITGGEVFLRKDFLPVVDTILTSCTRLLLLHFPTNGYLTDAIVAGTRTIASWSPKKLILTVSVDGDQALNDEVRGIEGGWRRQIETFRRLRELDGVDVVLGFTLSRHNAGQLERCFDAARAELPELTWDDFHVNVAHRSEHYYGNHESDLVGDADAAIRADLVLFRSHRRPPFHPVAFLEHEYLRRLGRFLDGGRTPVRCHALRSSCFLDPFGEVYPCSLYSRPIGNVRDAGYDLRAIWDRAETRRLQRAIWDGDCPHCWTPCEAYQSILGSLLNPANLVPR